MPPLPQMVFSADYSIRVSEVVGGLVNPWSMQWLPNGDILITERPGRLRIVRDGVLDPTPIPGVPEVRRTILGGLLDVVLHPDFATNRTLYLSYAKTVDDDFSTTAVSRARFDGTALADVSEIFVANTRSQSAVNFGGRMVFGPDGKLYLTVGERQEQDRAQDPMDHGGKVLRLNDDGTVPDDNPFVDDAEYLPEIFSLGHRSEQGLAVHPETGQIWETEHGPLGGDEVNVLVAGANYGWPLVSYGSDYDGTQITETGQTTLDGYEPPLIYWVPSIGISSLSFYEGDAFAAWQGNALVGALMHGRVRGSGHFQRLTFENGRAITREPILLELRQRIRDVRPGPDGLIYVLTDENPGMLLRLEPIG
ncbi:MAG: PQQ-dependent sugar dehydrogenase [Gammaproteobacteria bacterium]|nr:PQQ-dependent sugar dehydrogenase [Gammaproteobacteria bacterium]